MIGAAVLSAAGIGGCDAPAGGRRSATIDSVRDSASPPAAISDTAPAIVFLGTSLTAGLGLDPDQAYPALIQQKLDSAGLNYRAVNAGVSGETSAGALARMDWVLRRPVAVLVIETGANDGLRGLDPDSLQAHIEAIIRRARRQNPPPKIALVQMEAPPNLGPRYTRRFEAVYPRIARQDSVTLLPFLLRGVAGIDTLNQADGIHPNAVGEPIVAQNVWEALKTMLAS